MIEIVGTPLAGICRKPERGENAKAIHFMYHFFISFLSIVIVCFCWIIQFFLGQRPEGGTESNCGENKEERSTVSCACSRISRKTSIRVLSFILCVS